ncbi:hypothetical protein [Acinetobacter pittii]|uniref:hypothetical protein n=1 Tax=Acinetobacter pittii TaxID=48296 RepID=UPI0008393B50|nr:hypothetical protein [Acinetobacter pittii]OCY48705.1 hypothetical protein BFR81_17980 [Acinetobacter pittii]
MNKKQLFAAKARRAADVKAQQDKAAQGPYELSMTFCVDEVNEVIDKYREETGLEDAELTPEHVAYMVYKGDLIICLKNILIPLSQEWTLNVDSFYFNQETEDEMTVSVEFEMEEMPFNEFKFGSKIKVDRGHGLKTRWKGINQELNDLLLAEVPEGYERTRSEAKLTCITGFTDYKCLQEFNFVKRVLRKNGIDGIRKVNEAIQMYKQSEVA